MSSKNFMFCIRIIVKNFRVLSCKRRDLLLNKFGKTIWKQKYYQEC